MYFKFFMNITEHRENRQKKRTDTATSVRSKFGLLFGSSGICLFQSKSGNCRQHSEYKEQPNRNCKYRKAYADAYPNQRQI